MNEYSIDNSKPKCRTCVFPEKPDKFVSLTDCMQADGTESLATVLQQCVPGLIVDLSEPHFPTQICQQCVEMLRQVQLFQKNSLLSQKRIMHLLLNASPAIRNEASALTIWETNLNAPRAEPSVIKKEELEIEPVLVESTSTDALASISDEDRLASGEDDDECSNSSEDSTLLPKIQHSLQDVEESESITTTPHENSKRQKNSLPASDASAVQCEKCPRRFANMLGLRAHMQVHRAEDDPDKQFICDLCGAKFATRRYLAKHTRRHNTAKKADKITKSNNGPKPFVCKCCNKEFRQSSTLKDHLRTHTGEQPYLCSECGKAFNSSSNLRQHLLRHIGEKNYECEQCPKKFPCLSDLASHRAVHSKLKPHICDVCGSAFGKAFLLKKHKMIHDGIKPYKCEYCEMSFVNASHMKRHTRTHTGEKPYKCKYCEKAFAQSNDLIKHLRFHVGECVYQCEMCPQAFRLASELRDHFTEHKNEDAETREKNLKALQLKDSLLRLALPKAGAPKQEIYVK